MKVYLEIIGGPLDGQTFSFRHSSVIGRESQGEIPIDLDNFISRRHARIIVEEPNCYLEDLNSTNGSFIGEQQVREKVQLANGQQFRVGRTVMEIRWETD